MITSHITYRHHTIKNTLLVFFNDNPRPSLTDIRYDCVNLYNPIPNPWFFYHIDDYTTEIEKYSKDYDNILLFGVSKGASASIVMGYIIKQKNILQNILCWAMSPVLNIEYGQSLKWDQHFISPAWDRVRNDTKIKNIVQQYGKVYNYIDCSFPILYSYSFHNDYWLFDKNTFDTVKHLSCVTEDYIECDNTLLTFQKQEKYKNIHNILGYYWKIKKDLFYYKLNLFINDNIK